LTRSLNLQCDCHADVKQLHPMRAGAWTVKGQKLNAVLSGALVLYTPLRDASRGWGTHVAAST